MTHGEEIHFLGEAVAKLIDHVQALERFVLQLQPCNPLTDPEEWERLRSEIQGRTK